MTSENNSEAMSHTSEAKLPIGVKSSEPGTGE